MRRRTSKQQSRQRRNRITVFAFFALILILVFCQLLLMYSTPGEIPSDSESGKSEEDTWALVLVNFSHPIEDGPDALAEFSDGQWVDERMLSDLQNMLDACRDAGLLPCVTSSYRTYEDQESVFNAQVRVRVLSGLTDAEAEAETLQWVARPGYSEHQTGLAVDINSADEDACPSRLIYEWLSEHCARYGFILRYPGSRQEITGIRFEPWHFRYVGRKAAETIMWRGITLEEYLGVE